MADNPMTIRELEALCAAWQEHLSLRDWRVTVTSPKLWEMGKEKHSAHIDWDLCEKAATLSLLPADHPAVNDEPAPYDEEEALVHELLHLHLAGQPRPDNDAETTMLEQAINAITRTLVGLKRRTMV